MSTPRFCFNCNTRRHFARDCPYRQPSFPHQPRASAFPPLSPPPSAANSSMRSTSQAPLLALPPPPSTQSANLNPNSNFSSGQIMVPKQPWWKLNQEKLDRVFEFMASELEARQEAIHEKERLLKEEEEKRKVKEAEEKALRKRKERQDFEERIGTIVGSKINNACELFLGKSDVQRHVAAPDSSRTTHIEVERDRLERQVDTLRCEYESIKKNMEEFTRTMKLSGNALKRSGAGVCITSPSEAPARGKARVVGVGTPTSDDFQKLLKAFNAVKEGKRIADMEVQALKERFERAISKLVRQGRTPRSNLARRMNEALDDDDQDAQETHEDGLDDLTLPPSPPKRASERLAFKTATTERAEFLKETKKYLKRLKKHDL
ncbi:hypothetical protein CBR_g34740 [Chara braunii]|uniref:CCHC-type domain-containing protein n=1 Tax=Chara braunii TaxID=69332 RepID=A0A388JYZ5_CHABU|nr:hypothetical protein CBR_g34740 [Chara braunii]|eukprot:GBG63041.1 hypothetical protein CBR_g34740 [Chara braunii]